MSSHPLQQRLSLVRRPMDQAAGTTGSPSRRTAAGRAASSAAMTMARDISAALGRLSLPRLRRPRATTPIATRPVSQQPAPVAAGSVSASAPLPPESPTTTGRPSLAILIVTSEAPPVVSGISKTVGMLQRGLTAQGHTVDVVSREDFPRFIRGEFRFSAFALYWPGFRRRLPGYDVVNLHGPVPTISEVFLLLAMTIHPTKRPAIVYTHHSDLSISSFERLCAIYNVLAGKVAHKADELVVSSKAYHHKLDRPAGKPVSVIPWAIESDQDGSPRMPRPAGRLSVLFVGQLRSYKGLHVLLDAVQDLPGVSVTVVGDGPLRSELEYRVSRPDLAHVSLVGRLSDEDLARAYGSHDVIVLPSTTTAEAYGLVLAEGMAAGCVPVASALPGVSELASETGLVFPPGNAAELRRALVSLSGDPVLLHQLSAASLARSRRLSVGSMAQMYERVFRSAVLTSTECRGSDAVPARWGSPADLLEELTGVLSISSASLSLVLRTPAVPFSQVWRGSAPAVRAAAPAARWVATENRPILVAPGVSWDTRLKPLLHRQESTSSILLPVHWTRRGISVVELSTSVGDGMLLGRVELSKTLTLLAPPPSRAVLPLRPRAVA